MQGLIHAMRFLLPLIEHRMCASHIYARWGKNTLVKSFNFNFGILQGPQISQRPKTITDHEEYEGGEGEGGREREGCRGAIKEVTY